MLAGLKLLLPALIPSWRFFDWIAPSPRIEYRFLKSAKSGGSTWNEFRPRPKHVSIHSMLMRLFWNPHWNESLYLVSCAEKLLETGAEHYSREILKRIAAELDKGALPYIQFRIICISRQGKMIRKEESFVSPITLVSAHR